MANRMSPIARGLWRRAGLPSVHPPRELYVSLVAESRRREKGPSWWDLHRCVGCCSGPIRFYSRGRGFNREVVEEAFGLPEAAYCRGNLRERAEGRNAGLQVEPRVRRKMIFDDIRMVKAPADLSGKNTRGLTPVSRVNATCVCRLFGERRRPTSVPHVVNQLAPPVGPSGDIVQPQVSFVSSTFAYTRFV